MLEKDKLPTPVFLDFPGGSASKESTCNAGDLSLIPGLGRSLEKETGNTPVFWPGEFHEPYSPWGHKESDTTVPLRRRKFSYSVATDIPYEKNF